MGYKAALTIAGIVVWASQCAAVPVRVSFTWPAGAPASANVQVHVRAVRGVGSSVQSLPVEADAEAEGTVLDLGEGVWQVQALVPGYWSEGAEVMASAQGATSLSLPMWPAATLHGDVVAAPGEAMPGSLQVRLSAVGSASGERAIAMPANAVLNCPINGGAVNCVAPAGLFDVRVEADGFVPRFSWDVRLNASQITDVGRTELRRGISVSGRAVERDGADPVGPCRATLMADSARRSGPEPDPDSAPAGEATLMVPLSARGYFQVVGVLPGRHVLEVDCPEASGMRELIVQGDGETQVNPPVQLEDQTLELVVTPKLDPLGRPWKLTVEATTPRLRRVADRVTLAADGHWKRRGLMAGNYRITVSTSEGTPWVERNFDVSARSGPLMLQAPSVAVKGRVLLGAQPVRARLLFMNQAGGEPVPLKSDGDGRFQGLLPVAAGTRESSWTVEAHVAQPVSTRRIAGVNVTPVGGGGSAWVDLALPLIPLRGAVVAEDGKPERGMEVRLEDSLGRQTTTSTDEDGRFEMAELAAGKYTAVAESEDGASDRTAFDVLDGSEKEVTLVVHPSRRVAFQVTSDQGPVADAAVQVWIEPGIPHGFARTDQNGQFKVKLPREITEVGLTIGAPGFAVKLTRAAVPNGGGTAVDPISVRLGTSGGRLQLELQPPEGELKDGAMLYVAHNGAIQDARTLGGWGEAQTGGSADGPAVVETIEPGDYALCVVADPVDLATVWMGTLPPDLCRRGTVQSGQTLRLEAVGVEVDARSSQRAR